MEKPNAQRNASPSQEQSNAAWKHLADEQKKLRNLQEQRELVRLQKEKELWRRASEFPKVLPDLHGAEGKKEPSPSPSDFFTKLRGGKLFE